MIEHIRTVGFKGFDIDEDIPKKVIYTGKNKRGKSARSGAIAIALYGHIPFSTAGKRPGDILDSFGNGSLIAAVTIGGKEFARKFSRNAKGGVSQSVQIDQKRASSENFAILLDRAGAPRIADVAEFMKQSEAKKIDTLFDLFPNNELTNIDTEIENAKEDVSRLEKKKIGAESTVVRLTNSKANLQTNTGTIAEVQAEIESVESQIAELEEHIKQAEIEEAGIKREQELKDKAGIARNELLKNIGVDLDIPACTEMDDSAWMEFYKNKHSEYQSKQNRILIEEQKTKIEDERKAKEDAEAKTIEDIGVTDEDMENFKRDHFPQSFPEKSKSGDHAFIDGRYPEVEDRFIRVDPSGGDDGNFVNDMANQIIGVNPFISIQRIIDALNGAGCGTCAALIVAKQELKKFKGAL